MIKDFIDMEIIQEIESGGDPKAFNPRSKCRGLYQISEVCLQEFNDRHPWGKWTVEDLFDSDINTGIARWYMLERIPAMLRYFNQPITPSNCLIAYNAGIKAVIDGHILEETREYLRRYTMYEKRKAAGDGSWRKI